MASTQQQILINGRTYSWADITVVILGRKVQGITAISWNQAQEKTNNFGQGNRATSRSRGNRTANASITLSLKEIVAIENSLPPGFDILDIKDFPVVVSYNNDQNQFVSYQLQHAEFLEFGTDNSQGDAIVEKPLPLIISQVKRIA